MAIIALVFASSISLLAGVLCYMAGFGVLMSLFVWLCSGSTVMTVMLQRYMSRDTQDPRHFSDEIEADILAINARKLARHGGTASHN